MNCWGKKNSVEYLETKIWAVKLRTNVFNQTN